uniref:NADH-ubiquinone oxidoreductase chain 6 n=1 Tax=Diaphanosoma excisum TaxID=2094052 RepID=A0A8A1RXD0_9CRUS|nr:NADH dehydrogenase subunit 6 [Diaphanosoma excisum]QST19910.1 NADH dehydrogenase subunit 6 [Diaphanosoma excisum]
MQFYSLSLLMFLIFIFPILNHPLAMGLNLLLSTIFIAIITSGMVNSFWISYTLLLILSGGLLVIFVYVSLLASNENFKSNISLPLLMFLMSFIVTMTVSWFKSDSGVSNQLDNFNLTLTNWLCWLYNSELYQFTMFIIIYLLITLLVVVFNTKKNTFPLRSSK